jgi:hypothetical protein
MRSQHLIKELNTKSQIKTVTTNKILHEEFYADPDVNSNSSTDLPYVIFTYGRYIRGSTKAAIAPAADIKDAQREPFHSFFLIFPNPALFLLEPSNELRQVYTDGSYTEF